MKKCYKRRGLRADREKKRSDLGERTSKNVFDRSRN